MEPLSECRLSIGGLLAVVKSLLLQQCEICAQNKQL